MKVILSRKGFDSSNGGCPSPIMPGGTLLSIPIPSNDDVSYSDIGWNGKTYAEILKQINPKRKYKGCHVDPDIRDNRVKSVSNWKPAFGQTGAAQGLLSNAGVEPGDIFLFFGWFRQIEETDKGYCYSSKKPDDFYHGNDLQVIFGYMQIGKILTEKKDIKKYIWHPHAFKGYDRDANNVLYIPSKCLSFNPAMKGYGSLDFRKDRVLTMIGKGRATWNEYDFLMPEHVYGNKKNSAKGEGLYYAGIWQELVVYESKGLIEWVKQIIR